MTTQTIEQSLKHATTLGSLEVAESYLSGDGRLFHGIDSVECGGESIQYINTGDTYGSTVCQDDYGNMWVGSWGDWYEFTESQQNERNHTVTCGNCGKRTDLNRDKWSDVICESCERNVSTGELPPA